MTVPIPTLDKFTHLGEMGYTQKTLQERLDKFYQDLTALNTIGELLERSLDQDMARQVLGVSTSGGATVPVPSGLQTTGTPDATTALFGDGSWKLVNATTKASIGLGNVDNTSDANKPVSGPQQTAINAATVGLATTGSVTTVQNNVNSLSAVVDTKAPKIDAALTGNTSVVNLTVTGSTNLADGSLSPTDLSGTGATGLLVLASVTQSDARTAINAMAADATFSIAQLPAGVFVQSVGVAGTRTTARADIPNIWTANGFPTAAILGDILINGPES